MASLSVSGLVPMSAAIAGSEVAMTVESMFSMNRAMATMSGTMRLPGMEITEFELSPRTLERFAPPMSNPAAHGARAPAAIVLRRLHPT